MIIINDGEGVGLGKSKFLRKINIKQVSLKNAIKVGKFAAPLVAGIIPGGGTAMKVLDSKVGRTIMKVAKSKVVRKGIQLSKSKVGKMVINQVKQQVSPQLQSVNQIDPETFVKSEITNSDNQNSENSSSEVMEKEPVGELTPIKPIEQKPKDNTMLYVVGAVVLGGGIYLATKK